jgi:hypothetical protein
MTRERIKDFKEIVLPFFTNYFLKENYENLGKSDAEEFEKDFNEILSLADKALEHGPVIDKARAEIEKLQTYKMFVGEKTVYVERDDVLAIIDKCRAESGE